MNIFDRAVDKILLKISDIYDFGYDKLIQNFELNQNLVTRQPVAVFTRTFNEGNLLLLWERFWGKELGYENVYIINNGGSDFSCLNLNPKTSLVNLPMTEVSHKNWAIIDSYFQRFLLQRYDWVIKVDTDELLLTENNLTAYLKKIESGIYKPENAVAIIHEYENEPIFDYESSISSQRSYFVKESSTFIRPIITSIPATWSTGNHFVLQKSHSLKDIYALHLHCLDFEQLSNRHKKWLESSFSKDDYKVLDGLTEYKNNSSSNYIDITKSEFDSYFQNERVNLPDHFLKKLDF